MLTLSLVERDRISMLRQVAEGRLGAAEVAVRLGVTRRQFCRMAAMGDGGNGVVMHAARGRASNRCLPQQVLQRAMEMARDPLYEDIGPTLLSEHTGVRRSGWAGAPQHAAAPADR